MSTTTITPARDLSKEAPRSPRDRIAGFAIASRTIDKCRASIAGTLGEYHYDCPLDNLLFSFKGITGDQFKAAVKASKNDEEVGAWLLANGTKKTAGEIKTWSDEIEASNPMNNPEKRAYFIDKCTKLGLDPETTTTFEWLEADDRESFSGKEKGTSESPVFPKTLHRQRANSESAAADAKAEKRGNTSSKSRDTHEDRGVRQSKTKDNSQTLPHGR